MAKRNFNGVQFSTAPTIVEEAGAAIQDVRNRVVAYDENGKVILAADATTYPIGVALIEAGTNDVSGNESGAVAVGDDVDILVHGICYAIANGAIAKGAAVSAAANGTVATATTGFVLGVAMSAATKAGDYVKVKINQYKA